MFSDQITTAHKKVERMYKTNYSPIIISKIYEKFLFHRMGLIFSNTLSCLQSGFRKGFSVQHCIAVMRGKCKKEGGLLTYLSKACACIAHDLQITKLDAYGFDCNSLQVMAANLNR